MKPTHPTDSDDPDTEVKGIICPACLRPGNRVLYTRLQTDGRVRVRECIRCGHQWRTEERTLPEEQIDRAGRTVRVVSLAIYTQRRPT
jgi:Zn ribbon nucleic-acid-binding protein